MRKIATSTDAARCRVYGFCNCLKRRDDPDVVARGDVLRVRDMDGERLALQDVRRRLVRVIHANRNTVLQRNPAPRGIHRIGTPLLIIRSDNQHRHRIQPSLRTKVLLHETYYSRNAEPDGTARPEESDDEVVTSAVSPDSRDSLTDKPPQNEAAFEHGLPIMRIR